MWNIPTKEQLDRIPRLYETDDTPLEEKTIYLHFFIGGCDWFVAEYDGDDLFFGFAILNGDYEMAEWGLVSFGELQSINIRGLGITCETDWTPKRARKIEKIKTGNLTSEHVRRISRDDGKRRTPAGIAIEKVRTLYLTLSTLDTSTISDDERDLLAVELRSLRKALDSVVL